MINRHKTALAGASILALALAGCGEEKAETAFHTDLESCLEWAETPEEETACRDARTEAREVHAEKAPRYEGLEICEEEHGEGGCEVTADDGDSVFMPMMMGYMLGSMSSGDSRTFTSTPAYATRGSNGRPSTKSLYTAGGNRIEGVKPGKTFRTRKSTLSAPKTRAPVMNRQRIKKTGGFGRTGTTRSTTRSTTRGFSGGRGFSAT